LEGMNAAPNSASLTPVTTPDSALGLRSSAQASRLARNANRWPASKRHGAGQSELAGLNHGPIRSMTGFCGQSVQLLCSAFRF